MKTSVLWSIVLIPALLGGCKKDVAVTPSNNFYLDPTADFASFGKVAILELENENPDRPELGKTLTQALADGLGSKHLFNIQTIYKTDPEWGRFNLSKIRTFEQEQWVELRKETRVDGVLYGTITRYRSYPQLLAAISVKLVDLRTGKLLWAFEDVWDSTDKNTELRIKDFFENQMRSGYEPLKWQIVLNSPNAFHKFVIFEVVKTLPSH